MRPRSREEMLEGAIRDALNSLQDESMEAEDRAFEAESILEEVLDEV